MSPRFSLLMLFVGLCLSDAAFAQDRGAKVDSAAVPTSAGIPTCASPVGFWENQMESLMNIKEVDDKGAMNGEYLTSTGAGGWHPLSGWANNDTSALTPEDMNAPSKSKVLSFTVKWKGIGRITSWTGFCLGSSDLRTSWHLGMPFTQYDWSHMLTGSDTFHPINPAEARALIAKHEAESAKKKPK